MSKYTTDVRSIVEYNAGLTESVGYSNTISTIEKSLSNIFDFDYPIWDSTYKTTLECKILMHYYTREIAFETVGLWKLKLATRLNEIMPYYNQLYESTILEFNPLYDVNYSVEHRGSGSKTQNEEYTNSNTTNTNDTSEHTNISSEKAEFSDSVTDKTIDDNSAANTNTSSVSENVTSTKNMKNRYSDTPQGSISNVEDNTYLTNVTIEDNTNTTGTSGSTNSSGSSTSNSTRQYTSTKNDTNNVTKNSTDNTKSTNTLTAKGDGTTDTNIKTTDDYVHTIAGKQNSSKSYMQMVRELRDNIINIDMMIINELSDLFMLLW